MDLTVFSTCKALNAHNPLLGPIPGVYAIHLHRVASADIGSMGLPSVHCPKQVIPLLRFLLISFG